MNKVLIIGNGFDLYHRLPTRYTDFLFFMNHWEEFKQKYNDASETLADEWIEVRRDNTGALIEESIIDFAKYKSIYEEQDINDLDKCANNTWIKYFNEMMPSGKNWIDFETEIYRALRSVEEYYNALPNAHVR